MRTIAFAGRFIWALVAAALAAGCTIGASSRTEIAFYDFGPASVAPGRPVLSKSLLVHDVVAPAWMDSASIFYRLAYVDAARAHAYAGSRWVMAPASLFGARLRQRLSAASSAGVVLPEAALRTEFALRVELDEFAQHFDAADRSRALVRLRATLSGRLGLVAQRAVSIEKPSATADARGGARALAVASDEAIDQLLGWVAAQMAGN